MPSFITTCFTIATATALLLALGIWALGDVLTTVTRPSLGWLFAARLITMAQFIILVQLSPWPARRMARGFGAWPACGAAVGGTSDIAAFS